MLDAEPDPQVTAADPREGLKDCPFDGGSAQWRRSLFGTVRVECGRCFAATAWFRKAASARAAWNVRRNEQ